MKRIDDAAYKNNSQDKRARKNFFTFSSHFKSKYANRYPNGSIFYKESVNDCIYVKKGIGTVLFAGKKCKKKTAEGSKPKYKRLAVIASFFILNRLHCMV